MAYGNSRRNIIIPKIKTMKALSQIRSMAVCQLLGWLAALVVTSCDGVIYDEEGDCEVTYQVKFRYDMNMKFADAFAHEVKSVKLYVFDADTEQLVWQSAGEPVDKENFVMEMDVPAGNYKLLAWCGLMNGESFTLQEDLSCKLNRNHDADGQAAVDADLAPLYHGVLECSLPDEPGVHTVTMSLTKNTNVVRVLLQHLSGEPMDKDQFSFRITDTNGWMAMDNSLLPDETITYHAWSTEAVSAGTESKAVTEVNGLLAELTVARLVKGQNPQLVITRNDSGREVVRIPLIDMALLIKGNYNRDMSDQEYLDRQDEYNMTFFLDESESWMNAYIYINSWKVVLQYNDL